MPGRPALVLVALAVLVAAGACSSDEVSAPPPTTATAADASPEPPQGEPAPEGIEGVVAVTGLTNQHTEDPVDYPSSPPLGGDHFPVWLNCAVYDEPVPVEPAVHSLEHGAVWITYRPDLPADDIAVLAAVADGETHVIVSPFPGLRAPVVVTAWGRQLDLDEVGDPRLAEFVDTYIRAGDAPEPGATCEGGLTL